MEASRYPISPGRQPPDPDELTTKYFRFVNFSFSCQLSLDKHFKCVYNIPIVAVPGKLPMEESVHVYQRLEKGNTYNP
jgi:hypothetical protein